MEKIKITNPSQFEKLVEELEKNPSLARGFRRGTVPTNFKEQWESVATALNARGPPNRTSDGWQKIWRDLKFKVKKKMVTNKAECKATGGGIFKQLVLSPLEEAVANVLQFQKQINPEGMVQGVASEWEFQEVTDSTNLNVLLSFEMERAAANSSSRDSTTATGAPLSTTPLTTTPPTTTPARATSPPTITCRQKENLLNRKSSSTPKKNRMERHELLKRHSKDQVRLLTDLSNSMSTVKRSLRDIRDIQEKRLKLELERSKREEELYKADVKIKQIEYMIKEKKLQLLNKQFSD